MDLEKYREESWVDQRVEGRPQSIHGQGAFATAPIAAGEIVIVWGGTIFTQEQVAAGLPRPGSVIPIGDGLYFGDGRERPCGVDDLVNHGCDPNVWLIDDITLAARRAIGPGEELTVDYATFELDPEWVMPFRCSCGSSPCRGQITGNDWRRAELQECYGSHWSPILLGRIRPR